MNEILFQDWIEKERRFSKKGKRTYLHFDPKFSFEKKITAFQDFFSCTDNIVKHDFYPFIKILITSLKYKKTDKKNEKGKFIRELKNKERPIVYAAHIDSLIFSWYSDILTNEYERMAREIGIYDNVLAYLEKGECNIEFSNRVFQFIKSKNDCVALTFDITGFFDNIDHEHLKKMWGSVLGESKLPSDHFKIYKAITEYCYVEKKALEIVFPELIYKKDKGQYVNRICTPEDFRNVVRKNKLIIKNQFKNKLQCSARYDKLCGIPQGTPISACLSNIYMIDFDLKIKKAINKIGGVYYRYCDDIIVVVKNEDASYARQLILNSIREYELEINDDKTEVIIFKKTKSGAIRGYDECDTDFDNYKNLQYLGFDFNGQNIYVRSSSIARYQRRTASRIRENLKAAYGKNSIGTKVFKKRLFNRYTEKGKRNFLSYMKRAEIAMDSKTIYRQYKNSIKKVNKKFLKKNKLMAEKRSKSML